MEKLADKLSFVQTFLFLYSFLFLLFLSSVSLFHVSAAEVNRSAMLQITMLYYLTRVSRMKGRVCQLLEVFQHEFANLSLPCEGRLRDKDTDTDSVRTIITQFTKPNSI